MLTDPLPRLCSQLALLLTVCWLQEPLLVAQQAQAQQVLERGRDVYKTEGARAALPIFQQALDLFRQSKDRRGEGVTLGLMGNCYKRFGEHARALDLLNQALSLKRTTGDRLEEARTLSHLGLLFWDMSQYSKAVDHLERSVSLARELGDRVLEAASLNNLGLVLDEQGNYRQSLSHYERAPDGNAAGEEADEKVLLLGNIGGVHLPGRFQ
jgi:tetratricopeptide (TPR) repeat protein